METGIIALVLFGAAAVVAGVFRQWALCLGFAAFFIERL